MFSSPLLEVSTVAVLRRFELPSFQLCSYKLQRAELERTIYSDVRGRCTDVVFVAEVHSLQSLPHDALQLSLRNPAEKQTGEPKSTAVSAQKVFSHRSKPQKTRHTLKPYVSL